MAKGSKGESNSNDPKASTDSSTTLEDEETKGENRISNFSAFTFFQSIDRSPFYSSFMDLSFHILFSNITTPVQLSIYHCLQSFSITHNVKQDSFVD